MNILQDYRGVDLSQHSLKAILDKTIESQINKKTNLPPPAVKPIYTHAHSRRGDAKLSQTLSYLIISIKLTAPAQVEQCVGLLSLLSTASRHPDCPGPQL